MPDILASRRAFIWETLQILLYQARLTDAWAPRDHDSNVLNFFTRVFVYGNAYDILLSFLVVLVAVSEEHGVVESLFHARLCADVPCVRPEKLGAEVVSLHCFNHVLFLDYRSSVIFLFVLGQDNEDGLVWLNSLEFIPPRRDTFKTHFVFRADTNHTCISLLLSLIHI